MLPDLTPEHVRCTIGTVEIVSQSFYPLQMNTVDVPYFEYPCNGGICEPHNIVDLQYSLLPIRL